MMTQINVHDVQQYLELLYPDAPPEAWLVVSWIAAQGPWCSRWFRIIQSEDATAFISQVQGYNVYTGIGLRHPDCTPAADKRGESAEVYALPGLWIEFDHNAGVHSAKNLPTPDELLAFIETLPFRFSLLVDSTGGYHGYALFKEPWILDTPTERDAAALLLRRFQRTIQAQAATYGWKVDSTADLARVLRPAGTLNHKSGHPQLVTILHEDAIRYNPSDIADASWLATIEDTYTPSMDNGHFPPTQLDPIVNGCAWLRHCQDDAATLPEPEWYGMLGILGRCVDGVQIAHEWSAPYPRYSKDETAKKLQHALQHGPLTCSTIRHDNGGEDYCRDCKQWGKVKSPIVLAMPRLLVSKGSQNGTTSTATPGQTVQDLDAVEVAQQTADALRQTLVTLADDAKEDAILDALPALAPLDTIAWMRLKRQIKAAVPTLNLNDLAQARSELRRASTSQAPTPTGSAQAQIAAALAQEYAGQLAYETSRKAWMTYANGLWTPMDTEYIQQRIGSYMDTLLHGEYSWYELSGVEHLLGRRLAQMLTLETPGWLPFRNGALHLETMTLHAHSPERPFTWQLPHEYAPQAMCPKTQAWLHEAVGGAHDQVQVLRAYAKAVVTRRVDLQRYLETIGPGGTGKGTYTRLLQALVGSENTFATELKHLEANRFELSNLRGKVLLMITDAERYSGPINALKAITGQDFVRMEEKFKAQRTEIAPVMVVVAANEPVQSADYTSGLERRRLSMYFRHRPATPRDLLSWKDGAWHGELAPEIPGVLNWVLALPDVQMEALLQQTTALVPSLKTTWAYALVDTNPLAEWANHGLILDGRKDDKDNSLAVVNVGLAHKLDRSNDYEHQDVWLYPHYRHWCDGAGGKPLSSRRFTDLLKDLFENQLRLEGVTHTNDNKGSRFHGLRLRPASDTDTPLLITKDPPSVTRGTPPVTAETRTSDGWDACDGCLHFLYRHLPTLLSLPRGVGVSIGDFFNNPSHPSHPSLLRSLDVPDPSHPSSVRGNGSIPSPSPASEPLSERCPTVGDWVWLLSANGVQQNATPYRILALAPDPNTADPQTSPLYAQLDTTETAAWWPLVQCERADPPMASNSSHAAVDGTAPLATGFPFKGSAPAPQSPQTARGARQRRSVDTLPDAGACPTPGCPGRLKRAAKGKAVFCMTCRHRAWVS